MPRARLRLNQTVAALRFLYEVTLDRQGGMVRVLCPKQPKRLPTVLSLDETRRFSAGHTWDFPAAVFELWGDEVEQMREDEGMTI